jgi:hypothetical protein
MATFVEIERCIIKAPTLADINRWSILHCESKQAIQLSLNRFITDL